MERENAFRRKRLMSFVVVLSYIFFGGCEYVAVLPTLWDYLQSLGVRQESWLGFSVSVYSVAGAMAGVIGGRLSDTYFHHTKAMVLISILIRAVGNFLYFFAFNVQCIFAARFLCGIGTSAATAMMAEVCRTTRMEERTTFLSFCNGMFQLGILLGPALQLFLSHFNFDLLGLKLVTPLNAPGLFLGGLWLVLGLLTVLLFRNLTEEFRSLELTRLTISENLSEAPIDEEGDLERAATPILSCASMERPPVRTVGPSMKQYLEEFVTDTYVMLMSLLFILFFSQIAIETVIPVITQDAFGYGIHENTLIYMCGGLEALLVYFSIAFIGKYVRESTLLIIGLTILFSAQVWLMVVLSNVEKGSTGHVVGFLMGVTFFYLGSPMVSIGNTALSSKVLSNETQGLGQGVRRLVSYSGLIFGPTWAGSTVRNPYLFLGVPTCIMMIDGVMLAFSHKRLREAEDKMLVRHSPSASQDSGYNEERPRERETTPLLRSLG